MNVLLKQLCPGSIQVHLFAGAFVHNFKAVAWQCGGSGFAICQGDVRWQTQVRLDVEHHEGLRVIKHLHGGLLNAYRWGCSSHFARCAKLRTLSFSIPWKKEPGTAHPSAGAKVCCG